MAELFGKQPPIFQLPLHTVVIEDGPSKVGWLQLENKNSPTRRSCWFNLESHAKRWFSVRKGLDPRCRIQTFHRIEDVLTAGRSLKSVGCTEIVIYPDDSQSARVIPIDDFIGMVEYLKAKLKSIGLDKRLDPDKVARLLKDLGLEQAPQREQYEALKKFGFNKLSLDHDSHLPIKEINLNCTREGCTDRWAELKMYHIKSIDLVLESVCAKCRGVSLLKYKTTTSVVGGALEPLKASTGPIDPENREYGCLHCNELLMRLRISQGASAAAGAKLTLFCAQCGGGAEYEIQTGDAKRIN